MKAALCTLALGDEGIAISGGITAASVGEAGVG